MLRCIAATSTTSAGVGISPTFMCPKRSSYRRYDQCGGGALNSSGETGYPARMDEQQGKRGRRRLGRRGRGGAGQPDESQQQRPASPAPGPPGPPGPAPAEGSAARAPRRDTRGQPRTERAPEPGRGRTHRPPGSDRDRGGRGDRGRREGGAERERGSRDRDRDRDRDRGPRLFEAPVPQDPVSIELGAKFKEAQVAVRDARKAMEKRKAEFDDEPEWMVQQYAEAERGIERGDMLGIYAPNSVEYAVALHGALMAGATVTTLNPLYREREVEHQLGDAGAQAVFTLKPLAPVVKED